MKKYGDINRRIIWDIDMLYLIRCEDKYGINLGCICRLNSGINQDKYR